MIADGISTELMLAAGWYEQNPLPGMKSTLGRVAWGAAWVAGYSWATDKLERDGHRTWARIVRWLFRGVEAYLVVHNLRLTTKPYEHKP